MESFAGFFARATSNLPYSYQSALADVPIASRILKVPTGAGKTAAAILPWLYRLVSGVPDAPRRLVYCLPMRVLVEQTRDLAKVWAARVAPNVRVQILMGGDVEREWEERPETPAILIGTQDMLLSRALNRGYAMSRYRWPVHFGLLNNDALWVCDEVQLMGDGLATTAQLAAFRSRFSTFGPTPTIWMSATLDPEMLRTVDLQDQPPVFELDPDDKAIEPLRKRLEAAKSVAPAPEECRTPEGLARFIAVEHVSGSQTLAVVNRVARAQAVFDEFRRVAPQVSCRLLHSRFRPNEKQDWPAVLSGQIPPEGRVLISTQVVEAGVDISSALLVTDLAPWPSLVQRFGRCNRAGERENGGRIFWVDRPLTGKMKDEALTEEMARPYQLDELTEAESRLSGLVSASPNDLPNHKIPYRPNHVLRRRDLIDLFDTTPDLSGYDLDISRFVRDENNRDVQIAWRHDLPTGADKANAPSSGELCSVPIGELAALIKSGKSGSRLKAVTWNALDGEWISVQIDTPLRPGMVIVATSNSGCYDTVRGWDPWSTKPVVPVPQPTAEQGTADDPLTFRRYTQTLEAHSAEVRDAMRVLLEALDGIGLAEYRDVLFDVALRHDWGKAHPVFQMSLNPVGTGPLLAKSKVEGRHSRKYFRHELASALAILQNGGSDLAAYLTAAHHGKVRLSIRALPKETKPELPGARFARGVHEGDILPPARLGGLGTLPVALDLEPMMLGLSPQVEPSWMERMLRLRDDLGPFRLAYLEALIVAADIRASSDPKEILP
ncbi:MAG: CRISPR-associated helicase Cas3' [Bryobacteraceae bacterium]